MVSTRRTAAVAADVPPSETDSEAPEEVSLQNGRASAAKRRLQDRELKASARRQAKEARKRRSSSSAATPVAGPLAAAEPVEAQVDAEQQGDMAAATPLDRNNSEPQEDLLPPEVVTALLAKRRLQAQHEQQRAATPALVQQQYKVKRKLVPGQRTVQSLAGLRPLKASGAATGFLAERLKSSRHQRSAEMLRPSSVAGRRVYAPALAYAG